jgi:hypothetical protein
LKEFQTPLTANNKMNRDTLILWIFFISLDVSLAAEVENNKPTSSQKINRILKFSVCTPKKITNIATIPVDIPAFK